MFINRKNFLIKMDEPVVSADIFVELASDTRISMLQMLQTNSCKASNISKELNLTAQEVHRNVERLTESNLMTKRTDGFLTLTSYGKIIIHQLSTFSFLQENQDYFLSHDVEYLPEKFIRRLGDLHNCYLVTGTFVLLEKWRKIKNDANEYVKVITSEVPPDFFRILVEKASKNITVFQIHGENTIIPISLKEELSSTKLRKLVLDKKLQRKMIKDVKIAGITNEKESAISFPDLNGTSDIDHGFASSDPQFHEWVNDYFEECWSNSDDYHISKLKIE